MNLFNEVLVYDSFRVSPYSCLDKDVHKISMPERSYCDSRHLSNQ